MRGRLSNLVLGFLQLVADSTLILMSAVLAEIASFVLLSRKIECLKDTFGCGDPPDTWFGISTDKLYDYLDKLGSEGRNAFLEINSWDFMPYMPTYTICFGALLVRLCRAARLPTDISFIFFFVMICDVIESSILGYATRQFPKRLSHVLLNLASIANKMKWCSFGFGFATLATLFIYNVFFSKNTMPHIERMKEF